MDLFRDIDPKFFFDGRLETYKNWPFEDGKNCNKHAMAEAGFIVVEPDKFPDYVECFICGKQLDGWEETDNPWEEHKKHQATCPYINLNKKNQMDWTVEETYVLMKIFISNQLKKEKEQILAEANKRLAKQGELIPKLFLKAKGAKRQK